MNSDKKNKSPKKKFPRKYSKITKLTSCTLVAKLSYQYMLLIIEKTLEQFSYLSDDEKKEITTKIIHESNNILTYKTIKNIYMNVRNIKQGTQ